MVSCKLVELGGISAVAETRVRNLCHAIGVSRAPALDVARLARFVY